MKLCNSKLCVACDEIYQDEMRQCPACGDKGFIALSRIIPATVFKNELMEANHDVEANKRGGLFLVGGAHSRVRADHAMHALHAAASGR